MKFCQKCGKELLDEAVMCPNCGCAVSDNAFEKKEASYDDALKNAATTNIISLAVLALGIVCWLLVNMWVSAILCLVAEFIALMPNSKVQKALKANIGSDNSKESKAKRKSINSDLMKKYPAYKFAMILAIIDLVCLIITVIFI